MEKKSRYSTIDLGSNSIRLMNASVYDGALIDCKKELIMTRLGKGVNESGVLSDESMNATFEALKEFAEKARGYGGEIVGAFATSAVRDSSNRDYFVAEARRLSGIEVTVIDGQEEARLGYLGVFAGISPILREKGIEMSNVMIIDIGGGSTEVIIGNSDGIVFSKSYNMGSVRMTEMFVKSDPPDRSELAALEDYVMELSKEIGEASRKYAPKVAVGIAGTITTIGAVSLGMESYDRDMIQNYVLKRSEIERIYAHFRSVDLGVRKTIKGLQPQRADIITSGTAILIGALKLSGLEEIYVSDYDNLEGILVEKGYLKP